MKRGGQGERRRNGSLAAKSLVNFAVRHGGYGGFSMDTAGETKGEEARGRRPICVGSRACTLLPIGGVPKRGHLIREKENYSEGLEGEEDHIDRSTVGSRPLWRGFRARGP